MPDPYERHGRNSWEWGPSPARGQARAAAADQDLAPAKRPPGKKDPSLCKAAHWKGPHVPEFRLRGTRLCHWWANWCGEIAWDCGHEQVCAGCGKVIDPFVRGKRCPDWREAAPEEQARLEAEMQEKLLRIAANRARRVKRPVITGPQGYRKPKAELSFGHNANLPG